MKLANSLEIESYELTASIPEELRVVVGRIHSCAFRVDSAQLHLVVSEQSCVKGEAVHVFSLLLH